MKFKHTFHVFIDNFSVTYKLLLYRITVDIIALFIGALALSPLVNTFLPEVSNVIDSAMKYLLRLLSGEVGDLREFSQKVVDAFNDLVSLFATKRTHIALIAVLFGVLYIISNWFKQLGNFAAASVMNDKMALHAQSPFLATLIKNLKRASVFSLIYVPLSTLYDFTLAFVFFNLFFRILPGSLLFFVNIFLFLVCIIFAISFKMTIFSDWLPALIRGKMKQGEAIKYAFSRKNKGTFNVLSNFVVMCILIFGINAFALICTLGVGMIITIPSSFLIIIGFELVNYYDRNEMKYFIDKNTIIKPEKEQTVSRQEFLRGDTD